MTRAIQLLFLFVSLCLTERAFAEVLNDGDTIPVNRWAKISGPGTYAIPTQAKVLIASGCGGATILRETGDMRLLSDCEQFGSSAIDSNFERFPKFINVELPEGARLFLRIQDVERPPRLAKIFRKKEETDAERAARLRRDAEIEERLGADMKVYELQMKELEEQFPEDFAGAIKRREKEVRDRERETAEAHDMANRDTSGAMRCQESSAAFSESLMLHGGCARANCPEKRDVSLQAACFPACSSEYHVVVNRIIEMLDQCSQFYPARACELVRKFQEVCTEKQACDALTTALQNHCER